jgi:hypothetical protein
MRFPILFYEVESLIAQVFNSELPGEFYTAIRPFLYIYAKSTESRKFDGKLTSHL